MFILYLIEIFLRHILRLNKTHLNRHLVGLHFSASLETNVVALVLWLVEFGAGVTLRKGQMPLAG